MIRAAREFLARHQFLRFLVTGGLNTLFGFVVYSVTILLGQPVWVALAAGNVAGIAFNFVTTGGYVFRDLVMARFPRFAATYLMMYAVNYLLIGWLSERVPNAIVAQAILTPPMTVLSYLLLKYFVFRAAKNPRGESRPQ